MKKIKNVFNRGGRQKEDASPSRTQNDPFRRSEEAAGSSSSPRGLLGNHVDQVEEELAAAKDLAQQRKARVDLLTHEVDQLRVDLDVAHEHAERVAELTRQNGHLADFLTTATSLVQQEATKVNQLTVQNGQLTAALMHANSVAQERADAVDELKLQNSQLADFLTTYTSLAQQQADRILALEAELADERRPHVTIDMTAAGKVSPGGIGGATIAALRGSKGKSKRRVFRGLSEDDAKDEAALRGPPAASQMLGIIAAMGVLAFTYITFGLLEKPYGESQGTPKGAPNHPSLTSNQRYGHSTRMRAASTGRVSMVWIGAWWESARAYLAFSKIPPYVALLLPLVHIACAHLAAILWAVFRYTTDPLAAHGVIDYGAAISFINFSVKAYKDLSEGLVVGWLEKRDYAAISVAAFLSVGNVVLFGMLSDRYGQPMLEWGIVVALALSALGSLQKTTVKLPGRFMAWFMRK